MHALCWGVLLLTVCPTVNAQSLTEDSVGNVENQNGDSVMNAAPAIPSQQVDPLSAFTKSVATTGGSSSGSSATNPSSTVDSVSGILGSISGGASGDTEISHASKLTTRGIIEGFMNGKVDEAELKCLEEQVSLVAADTFQSGEDIVRAIIAIIPELKEHVNFIDAVMSSGVIGKVTDAGSKIMDLVSRVQTLAKGCVKEDALLLLNQTAKHLMNLTYVANRLVVNTVNITEFLSDSIVQWGQKDWQSFGNDIGTTVRKILLSNSGSQEKLPEGIPPPEILEEVFEGALMGFFVKGTNLDIRNKVTKQDLLKIDLKQCIADNHLFFRSAYKSAWFAIAQLQNTIKEKTKEKAFQEAGLQAPTPPPQGQPAFIGEAMMGLAQIPSILMSCNINAEAKEAFGNGKDAMKNIELHMSFPDIKINTTEVSLRVEQAAEFWEEHDFDKLGIVTGLLMRDLALLIYPKKYQTDSKGFLRLKRILLEEQQNTLGHRAPAQSFVSLDAGLGLLAVVAVAAVAFRAVRIMKVSNGNTMTSVDEEAPLRPFSATEPASRQPLASSSMLLADLEVVEA